MASINIDIDNTVNDFLDKFCIYLNSLQLGKTWCKWTDFTDYSISNVTGIDNNTLEIMFFKNNCFYEQLEPLARCQSIIENLVRTGHNVRFVTSIRYDVIQARIDFIKKYFPYIDTDKNLIVTNDKSSIYADIVIDDYENNFHNVNDCCYFIVFNQPWNTDVNLDRIYGARAHDWDDVDKLIRRFLAGDYYTNIAGGNKNA